MLLTVSKRVEFSASRRLFDRRLSEAENLVRFGDESAARFGTGRNYVACFVFSGTVDPATGMLMNISEIKHRVNGVLEESFDHKFLNEDNPAFADLVPTAENVARQLFLDAQPLFKDAAAQLVACHLCEADDRSATIYATGVCDANYWFEFSAARQTMSPHLTAAENAQLFGVAASPWGHGHHYRARLTFAAGGDSAAPFARDVCEAITMLRDELDHKNLNHEVPGLRELPITTESLSRYIYEKVNARLSLERVRLHERSDFFAEFWQGGRHFLGMRKGFSAAHRLHAPTLSAGRNLELFGRCNNPRGHGHRYLAEATIGGPYDERTGTLCSFSSLEQALTGALHPWQDKHLDLETEEFRDRPSTGENIVAALWLRLESRLDQPLERLRLWETANNRFTLRRSKEA
ncbi:MAG: 6-carboxytetrahydropterin synthase [Chthoniobacterales bacterium]